MELDATQREAIEQCLNPQYRVVTVSGPAGSGKTTIAKAIYAAFTQAGYVVALSAPTGRAARRQSEVTGLPASTNHKLLEFPRPGDPDPVTGKEALPGEPRRTKQRPIDANVLLLDEGMMVDPQMYRYLVDALPPGGLLRVFGDKHQLKPVDRTMGPPPFLELMKKFPTTHLETIHRQGTGSSIIANGARIIEGKLPQRTDEFLLDISDAPATRLYADFARNKEQFCSTDYQVICPMKKGHGTDKLNVQLQKLRHQGQESRSILVPRQQRTDPPILMYVGDKILVTKNDYALDVMNGDIGIIVGISETGEIEAEFSWGLKTFPTMIEVKNGNRILRYDPRTNLTLGYAITTHKAQGSEWHGVYYIVPQACIYMANRTNFYTGITRARDFVKVFATPHSLRMSVRKDRDDE